VKHLLDKSDDPYLTMLTYRATPLQSGYSPAELLMGRRLRTRVPVAPNLLLPSWPELPQMKAAMEKQKQSQKKNYDRRHKAKQLPALSPGDPVWVTTPKHVEAKVTKCLESRSYELTTSTGAQQRRNRRHLNRRLLQQNRSKGHEPMTAALIPHQKEEDTSLTYVDEDDVGPALPVPPQPMSPPQPVSPLPMPATPATLPQMPATPRPPPIRLSTSGPTVTRSGRVSKPPKKLSY
jgi:hypothetical protein